MRALAIIILSILSLRISVSSVRAEDTRPLRILIVDDEAAIRLSLPMVLKATGNHQYFEAENGRRGLEILREQLDKGEPIDFVISDRDMATMTGIELRREMLKDPRLENLFFVLHTANAFDLPPQIAARINMILVKPAAIADIRASVTRFRGVTAHGTSATHPDCGISLKAIAPSAHTETSAPQK